MPAPFFVHFGCWNNPRNPHQGMQRVMKSLLRRRAPQYYLVAGDNYYPRKEEPKKRIFNKAEFDFGFDYLKRLAKKAHVYLLMGNHDLDYEKKLYDGEKLTYGCSITEHEMVYAHEFNMVPYSINSDDGKTLILLMNSHYYSSDYDPLDKDCVKYYRSGGRAKEEATLAMIVRSRRNTIQNLIVVAHLPIVTRRDKIKEGNFMRVVEPLNGNGLQFLHKLYSLVNDRGVSCYYLCADTHQYQEATVQLGDIAIKQYVVGTGGTSCDDEKCPPSGREDIYEPQENPYGFTMSYTLERCERSYGYLECHHGADNKLRFRYKQVSNCSPPVTRARARTNVTHRSRSRSRSGVTTRGRARTNVTHRSRSRSRSGVTTRGRAHALAETFRTPLYSR